MQLNLALSTAQGTLKRHRRRSDRKTRAKVCAQATRKDMKRMLENEAIKKIEFFGVFVNDIV
jgi:serine/threonine-protein kinase RIO1